jgi:hypothetical protein
MGLTERLRRAAGAPLRRYLDPRLQSVDARVLTAGTEARADIARAKVELLEELDRRFGQMAYDLAAVSRAHVESIGYVAAELARTQATLGDELAALREEVAAGPALRTAATDAYAVRGLAPLPAGSRVLAAGHGPDLAPLHLAALGHRVTVVAARPYPFEHANLEAMTGRVADLPAGDHYDAVVLAPGADGELEGALERLAVGGILVAGVEPPLERLDGLEELDRAGAGELLLLTARRP